MDLSLLSDLGLSPNEAKIYHALLIYGGSGVSTISLRAHVHRRNAYDALQRLLEKGLVSEVYEQAEITYEPVEPGKLMELVREKEMRLEKLLPELREQFHQQRVTERAFIYKGPEGVKNYLRLVLKSGKDMYILGAEGAWFDPRLLTYTTWFLREMQKKRAKLHVIFDDDAHHLPYPPSLLTRTYKFLSPEYDTNSTMDIFGDYVVTYTGTAPGKLLDDVTIFVMYSPALAESYRTWWQCLWDQLPNPASQRKRRSRRTASP